MATGAKKGSSLSQATGLTSSDFVVTIANVTSVPNNFIVNTATFFSNTAVPHITVGNNAMSTANLIIRPSAIPTTSSSPGVQGQVVWSNTFIYVCIANNTWGRAALSTAF